MSAGNVVSLAFWRGLSEWAAAYSDGPRVEPTANADLLLELRVSPAFAGCAARSYFFYAGTLVTWCLASVVLKRRLFAGGRRPGEGAADRETETFAEFTHNYAMRDSVGDSLQNGAAIDKFAGKY